MKKVKYITFLLLIILTRAAIAQVGIGTVVPDTNSILDLNNSYNKGLRLPLTPANLPTGPIGLMFYNPSLDLIQYLETGGLNSMSPWKYKVDGSASENTYFNEPGNVGIGLSNPSTKLHIKQDGELMALDGGTNAYMALNPVSAASTGSYFGFYYSGTTTFSLLKQNTGNVKLETNSGTVNVTGKIQEYGYDLMPAGTIMIWTELSPPPGWALCNGGGNYIDINGVSRNIPNLTSLFVLGGNNSNNATTGGSATVTLTASNLPSHTHAGDSIVVSATGSHSHNFNLDYGSENSSSGTSIQRDENAYYNETNYAGSHNHDIQGTSGSTGSGASIPNIPPYISMYYIIKL